MEIVLETGPIAQAAADALVFFEFEGLPSPIGGERYQALRDCGEICGKSGEITVLHHVPDFAATRVAIVGAGKAEKFDTAEMRKSVAIAVRHLKKASRKITLVLDRFAAPEFVSAAVEGALLGDFEPDHNKSERTLKPVERFALAVPDSGELAAALEKGRILGDAQNYAREVANEPPNKLTPLALADTARKMAAQYGLECDILEEPRMKELGMGALLGVAMGSDAPPALIVLHYKPAQASKSKAHLALIGKGVTFDTGGISIKPSDNMDKMKYDMAGGAAVLGAMQAIAQLKPHIPVTALIPTVENMPGSRAQRPGDIVKSMSGKTIEVLNTDAEGRLILADAMTYAKQLGCTHLVDAATLTGAVAVALGTINAGVFSNDESLQQRWLRAAKAEGEKMWAMPMDEEYRAMLKSDFADIPNISGARYGGAITAAMFLREFTDGTPWVHLDIAGTAWLDDAKPHMAKGPTGTPLRSFVNLAMTWHD